MIAVGRMGCLARTIRFGGAATAPVLIASACSQPASTASVPPGDAGLSDVTAAGDVAVDDASTSSAMSEGGAATDVTSPVADAGLLPDAVLDSPHVDAGTVSYSTTFPLTETPISESGHWVGSPGTELEFAL